MFDRRADVLVQIRAEIADLARMSEKADQMLADSTNVITDSQLQDIRERLERMEGEYVEIIRDLAE